MPRRTGRSAGKVETVITELRRQQLTRAEELIEESIDETQI